MEFVSGGVVSSCSWTLCWLWCHSNGLQHSAMAVPWSLFKLFSLSAMAMQSASLIHRWSALLACSSMAISSHAGRRGFHVEDIPHDDNLVQMYTGFSSYACCISTCFPIAIGSFCIPFSKAALVKRLLSRIRRTRLSGGVPVYRRITSPNIAPLSGKHVLFAITVSCICWNGMIVMVKEGLYSLIVYR